MIRQSFTMLGTAALCLQLGMAPAKAEMSHDEKVAAAAALLGIATLLHNKHHYKDGYSPAAAEHAADFETCYRDGLHGYPYTESSRDCAEGWQAGNAEREKARAHRQNTSAVQKAPPMAVKGCANLMATNFTLRNPHAKSTCGCGEAGESTSSTATCTSAYDVPPRDSGP